MLHAQAHAGDGNPAHKAHDDGLAAGADHLDQVGVQADGRHGHDDEELGQFLQGLEQGSIHTGSHADGGDDRSQQEEEDEEGEHLFQREAALLGFAALAGLGGAEDGQHQGDGDDGQGAGQLDDGGAFQGVGAGMQPIPGSRRRGDGGGIVDGGAREQGKALVAQAQLAAQPGDCLLYTSDAADD